MGWILLGVVLVLGLGVALLYNGLATVRSRTDRAWVQIETHEELLATGGRIAYAGLFYNDTVSRYNTKIESFPARLLARPLQFRVREYFGADDTSRPVRVDA